MFFKTRKRLTVFFTVLIIMFLIAFNGIGYFLLTSYVYSSQEKEILRLADKYTSEQKSVLEQMKPSKPKEMKKHEDHEDHEDHKKDEKKKRATETFWSFFIVVDKEGRLISGEIPMLEKPTTFIQELTNWKPRKGDIRYFAVENNEDVGIELLLTGQPITEKGEYLGTLYVGADVSPQKVILKEIMSILIGLSALFIILSALLGFVMSGRAMKPIAEAFERQRRFVSNASHELRTPLTVMHASLEVLESEEGQNMQPFSRQVLDDLKDETQRMSSMVSFLLTLAQGDSSTNQLAMETFSLREELVKFIRKIKPLADEKELSIQLDASSDLTIHADKERILQLIIILVDNALQYTPKHGNITVTATSDERTLTMVVADTGIGIPKELHEEIFERFYRGDPSRGRGKSQTGLGLSIVKWIVEAHGGNILVRSAPGQGSAFTVKLPVSASLQRSTKPSN
ncbi:ATP-binding protein [Paenibacillus sp.]|jgi:signal transduction histidine kinase|uniref:sensor histidine kinase n=1 Tax=Paenibacillus sp. TaxID=58172 RepID=UPI0028368634|nr:ATP-binding protein [Paenibacillus sp.]MDR0267253.1 HAMP domain-containing histidine kinase [Paenibacillus sp.]